MKRLLLHIFFGFIILFSFVYLSLYSISEITMHGETILVPNLRSFSISEVDSMTSVSIPADDAIPIRFV